MIMRDSPHKKGHLFCILNAALYLDLDVTLIQGKVSHSLDWKCLTIRQYSIATCQILPNLSVTVLRIRSTIPLCYGEFQKTSRLTLFLLVLFVVPISFYVLVNFHYQEQIGSRLCIPKRCALLAYRTAYTNVVASFASHNSLS